MHLRRRGYQRRFAIVMGQKSQLWPDLPALDTFELNRASMRSTRTLTAARWTS